MVGASVVFRTDASDRIGTGHVARCVTLAQVLASRGVSVTFVCREHRGHLMDRLRSMGLDVRALAAPTQSASSGDEGFARWLGVSEVEDAEQTIAAISGETPLWLVVDHYGIGAVWERRIRLSVERLLVIDDLADRDHECDVLLDPNHWVAPGSRHAGRVPQQCLVLVGAQYALLGPEYARRRSTAPAHDGRVRRVLVYFGGTDPHNLTGMTLTVLSEPEFHHLDVDIVVGPNNANREVIRSQAVHRPRTAVHDPRAHLADLMVSADLAIGAGGVATWERMCLGLPAVVVCIAENQRPTCETLSADGLILYVGDWTAVGPAEIAGALRRLLAEPQRLRSLSARGAHLIDGLGALRVADIMTGNRQ